ncbi:glycoside hydrolase family 55 protein [Stigmatella aurantiaca]|uniref:Conserved uncharacterized protein n=1 Tax=Stigmatella aurantiaca (strain DW4/3-1) TaxID=378806 RepID=Q09C01_STIAD|nr:glycoside hydrolase family 55 protein [Stigmatella aurantiaca]ADO74407.1 conserved uncharacterized protein [Stigmatella aurantiaca DW4/3-1]EAU69288.1 hypothetical protein STIAU_8037 [Stigmatella aurantiaca DW4/3-1]
MNTSVRWRRVFAGLGLALGLANAGETQAAWRSVLYPATWKPGDSNPANSDQFLHDFSYAGYRMRQAEPPFRTDRIIDVTQAPYYANNTGGADVTAILQRAIDDAGALSGGAVVFLPKGTYRVAPPSGKNAALTLNKSHVVLRGQGPTATFLYNDAPNMRGRSVVRVGPASAGSWTSGGTSTVSASADLPNRTTRIPLTSVSGFSVGQWIVLRTDMTSALIDELGMAGKGWESLEGATFYRQITAIDTAAKTLTIDIPLRSTLKTRDNARVYKIGAHISEVGVENLAIGMRENTTPGTGGTDFSTPGTGAYEMHDSFALKLNHTVDGWLINVRTYRPASNLQDIQVLSNGIDLYFTRNITVDSCDISKPQYKGEGGNGYLFSIRGSDNLIKDSAANRGRHNFNFRSMNTTGNVLFNDRMTEGSLVSDFHMHLSAANLLDNVTLYLDSAEAADRSPYGTTKHGVTSTQSVFWNTNGAQYHPSTNYIVKSQQHGYGYVIGVRGSATRVNIPTGGTTAPTDFAETSAPGTELQPQSLYVDQIAKRLGSTPEHAGEVLIYQAENLPPSNAGDVSSTNVEAGALNGAVRYHNTSAVGAKVTYTLYPRTIGTFRVQVRTKKNNGRGQYQLDIDGAKQGPVQDDYSSTTAWAEADLGTVSFPDLNPRVFTFTTTGKNAASSGFNVAVDAIQLTRQ